MLVIRMQRTGRKGHAMFRVVVQDSRRTPTSGKIVAQLGSYDPHSKAITLNKEKAQFYLDHGAQPSERVARLLAAEGVKLPAWVLKAESKTRTTRNPDKRRSTRPPEAAPAETPAEAEPTEIPAEEATPAEAPTEEPATEATSEASAAEESTTEATESEAPSEEAPTSEPEAPAEAATPVGEEPAKEE